jgi:acetate kinase
VALLNDVLVVNAGSTSLKLSIVDEVDESRAIDSLRAAPAVAAVGHRIVHGGDRFVEPTLVDEAVLSELEALVELAPLHNAPAIAAIREARRAMPNAAHVAVFDTAFHRTMPAVARTYLLPERFRALGIHRFGFHGLSVAWAASRVTVPRLVVCHLGGGASVTAVRDGASVDTTMGFTPLEGVPMATRAGSIDPGVLLYLLRHGVGLDDLDDALEHESGLTGLAGTGDVAELERAGTPEAGLALDVYCYRIAQAVAAMSVALGGIDALVFTAGVGEHSPRVRADVCGRLKLLGVALDGSANAAAGGDADIAAASSRVAVRVVVAREDVVVARAVRGLVQRSQGQGGSPRAGPRGPVP